MKNLSPWKIVHALGGIAVQMTQIIDSMSNDLDDIDYSNIRLIPLSTGKFHLAVYNEGGTVIYTDSDIPQNLVEGIVETGKYDDFYAYQAGIYKNRAIVSMTNEIMNAIFRLEYYAISLDDIDSLYKMPDAGKKKFITDLLERRSEKN